MSGNGTERLLAAFGELRSEAAAQSDRLRAEMAAHSDALRAELNTKSDRLPADVLAQSERLLNEMAALRDGMTVVMARLDRVDATAHGAVTGPRALHRSFARTASRVTELESKG